MEPNRKYTPDIEPDIRPDLRSIPGGGQSTPERGNLGAVPNTPSQELDDAERKGTFKQAPSNVTPLDLYQRENQGDKVTADKNAIVSTFTGKKNGKMKLTRAQIIKRTGLFGGGGIIGLVIFIISGIAPVGGILINLAEVSTVNKDRQNNILTNRLYKVIDAKMTNNVTNTLCTDVTKAACRFSRPSNAFLSRLNDYGITALNADGTSVEKKTLGYPNQKPASYSFTASDGSVKNVSAPEFTNILRSDSVFRGKFVSAYNMRYIGYADSYIKKLFYNKFSIDRTGKTTTSIDGEDPQKSIKSIADGTDPDNKVRAGTTADEKNNAARAVLDDAVVLEADKVTSKLIKSKADPILTTGTLVCAGINAPGFFTKVSRLYQMRQEIALASAIVLTAASMAKAGDIDPKTMTTIGGLLTATKITSDGKTSKSAMDSVGMKNLLFNDSGKVNNKFIPGYKAMQANKGITSFAQNQTVKDGCEAVNSPQAAAAALAIEAGIGAATVGVGAAVIFAIKGTVFLGMSVLGAQAISGFVASGMQALFSAIPPETIAAALENEDITNATNEDLGDVLAGGINYFYSNSALSTGAAPSTISQAVVASNESQQANIAYAEKERAGKSPFDVSSPYTFLGSMVASYYTQAYSPDNKIKTITSSLGYMLTQPFKALTSNTYAATDNTAAMYSHAEEFGLDPDLAVGAYGELYATIPSEYMGISTEDLVASQAGEYNEDTGSPKADGKIQEVLDMCSTGDLLTASGCVIDNQERANRSIYMTDLRLSDTLDGREYIPEEAAAGEAPVDTTAPITGAIKLPVDAPYSVGDDFGPRPSPCPGCSTWHVGYDFSKPVGSPVYAAMDGEVTRVGVGINNILYIKHADGLVTTYWHMSSFAAGIVPGAKVAAGQVIGGVGTVGQSTGNHLHFELDISGVADASVYDRYTKNSAGPALVNTRIDPQQFFTLNGVAGI